MSINFLLTNSRTSSDTCLEFGFWKNVTKSQRLELSLNTAYFQGNICITHITTGQCQFKRCTQHRNLCAPHVWKHWIFRTHSPSSKTLTNFPEKPWNEKM